MYIFLPQRHFSSSNYSQFFQSKRQSKKMFFIHFRPLTVINKRSFGQKKESKKEGRKEARKQGSKEARKEGRKEGSKQASKQGSKEGREGKLGKG